MNRTLLIASVVILAFVSALAQQAQAPAAPAPTAESKAVPDSKSAEDSLVIPKGSKLFIAPMPDNFNEYLKAAIVKKNVPVTIVENRDQADFEVTGHSETQKAGAAKILLTGSWHSRESASIKVANLKSGVVAFSYSYDTNNSTHGKKTSSESCAKHLKEKIDSGK